MFDEERSGSDSYLHLFLHVEDAVSFWHHAQQGGISQDMAHHQQLGSDSIAIYIPDPPDTWRSVLNELATRQCTFYGEATSAQKKNKRAFVAVGGVYRTIELAPNGDLPICTLSTSSFKNSAEQLRPFVALWHQCEEVLQLRSRASARETLASGPSITDTCAEQAQSLPEQKTPAPPWARE